MYQKRPIGLIMGGRGLVMNRPPRRTPARRPSYLGSLADDSTTTSSTASSSVNPSDIEMDCEDQATWQSDPTCQVLHPGLFPMTGGAGTQITTPTPTTSSSTPNLIAGTIIDPSMWNTASSAAIPGFATSILNPANWTFAPATPGAPPMLLIAGAVGIGAYFLFSGKKKGK